MVSLKYAFLPWARDIQNKNDFEAHYYILLATLLLYPKSVRVAGPPGPVPQIHHCSHIYGWLHNNVSDNLKYKTLVSKTNYNDVFLLLASYLYILTFKSNILSETRV